MSRRCLPTPAIRIARRGTICQASDRQEAVDSEGVRPLAETVAIRNSVAARGLTPHRSTREQGKPTMPAEGAMGSRTAPPERRSRPTPSSSARGRRPVRRVRARAPRYQGACGRHPGQARRAMRRALSGKADLRHSGPADRDRPGADRPADGADQAVRRARSIWASASMPSSVWARAASGSSPMPAPSS